MSSKENYNDDYTERLQDYVGIKRIKATPMGSHKYKSLNDVDYVPSGTNVNGYIIEYPDGYTSWSPADVFEESYKKSGEMSYPMALFLLQQSKDARATISRTGWNGAGQYVVLISGASISHGINQFYGNPDVENKTLVQDCLFLRNSQGNLFAWFPSQGDSNANDWQVRYID